MNLDEFNSFWLCYPRKIGKKAAQRAWLKATDKPELVDIIQAIEKAKQSEQWRKDNGAYIPHPATWLNQGRWDDVFEVEIVPPKPVLVGPKSFQKHEPMRGEFVPMPDGWLESVVGRIGRSMP